MSLKYVFIVGPVGTITSGSSDPEPQPNITLIAIKQITTLFMI